MSEPVTESRTHRIMRAIEPLVYGRRPLAMAILLLLTAFFAWQAMKIQPDASFDSLIPLQHPYMQVYQQYRESFGGANTLQVALTRKDGDIYDSDFLHRLRQVNDAVAALPHIDRSQVQSLFAPNVTYNEAVEGGFFGAQVIPAGYPAQGDATPQMLAKLRDHVRKAGLIGRLVSNDQRGAMVQAGLLEVDPVSGAKLDYALEARLIEEQIRGRFATPDVDIHIVGFAERAGDLIGARSQAVRFLVLTLAVILLLLWLYLGDFELAALPLLCSVVAVIWQLGLLRLLGRGLDPLAMAVPFLILAVSLSHGVQQVNAWAGEIAGHGRSSLDASRFGWRRLAAYGAAAMLADLAGFAAIDLIPVGMIREMALDACLGMLAIVFINTLMLPILLSWIGVRDAAAFKARLDRRDGVFDGLWRLLSNIANPRAAAAVLLVCAVLLGWGFWEGKNLQIGDSRGGAAELSADSRYNKDAAAVVSEYALGTDLIKVIAETDADGCIDSGVMDQIYHLAWRLDNTEGVRATQSLPELSRQVYSIFVEGSPKFDVLARNKDALAQAIKPIPPSTGMLNGSCSAMPIWTYLGDHRAGTIRRVVNEVNGFEASNAAEFFETHKDVDAAYCDAKNAARRELGAEQIKLRQMTAALHRKGLSGDQVKADSGIAEQQKAIGDAGDKLKGMNRECPVNFALASGSAGVMAAADDLLEKWQLPILYLVYGAIAVCLYLAFAGWQGMACIVLPLALVSMLAYAVMAALGIGLSIATLPVVALAAGIGVDYGVYLYAAVAEACAAGDPLEEACYKALKMSGKGVLFTGITLSAGVATWLFSGLPLQRDIGELLVFIFGANMLCAILLLPAFASFLLRPGEHVTDTPLPLGEG